MQQEQWRKSIVASKPWLESSSTRGLTCNEQTSALNGDAKDNIAKVSISPRTRFNLSNLFPKLIRRVVSQPTLYSWKNSFTWLPCGFYVCVSECLSNPPHDSHEIWHEGCAAGGHSTTQLRNFLQSVIARRLHETEVGMSPAEFHIQLAVTRVNSSTVGSL